MINGSSSLVNIHYLTAKQPSIRATVKVGEMLGEDKLVGDIPNDVHYAISPNVVSIHGTVFQNKYIISTSINLATAGVTDWLHTYDSGASLISSYGPSRHYTTEDLYRGSFINTGNTLELVYIQRGLTSSGSTTRIISEIKRVSTTDGTLWSGTTILSRFIANPQEFTEYNGIFMTGRSSAYLSGSREISPNSNIIIENSYYWGMGTTPYSITDQLPLSCVLEGSYRNLIIGIKNDFSTGIKKASAISIGNTNIFFTKDLVQSGSTNESIFINGFYNGGSVVYTLLGRLVDNITKVNGQYIYDRSYSPFLLKTDLEGKVFTRQLSLGSSFLSGMITGGVSSLKVEEFSIIYNNGASKLYITPVYINNGISLSLDANIISYDNLNNDNISLRVSNSK